jgi:hypothetical protein
MDQTHDATWNGSWITNGQAGEGGSERRKVAFSEAIDFQFGQCGSDGADNRELGERSFSTPLVKSGPFFWGNDNPTTGGDFFVGEESSTAIAHGEKGLSANGAFKPEEE